MHEFGAAYRMTLNPGTAEERILLDIPTWSFEWQLTYTLVETLVLDADDVLRLECTWDRSDASGHVVSRACPARKNSSATR